LKTRITYYDSLRGLAIIGVVFIHVLKYNDPKWKDVSIVFRQIINFSVPLFLALSGFFLADKEISNKKEYLSFLRKQIPRVYYPYAVWSFAYIILNILILKKLNIEKQLFNFLIFQTIPIFYFVALIIQYYIFLPFFKKVMSKRLLLFAVTISFLSCITIYGYQYFFNSQLPLILYAGNGLTWLMFFVLGMYLRNYKIPIHKNWMFFWTFVALIFSILETYTHIYFTVSVSNAVSAVKVSSFIYAALIIILFLNYGTQKNLRFSDLGKVSYAIYLNHILILMIVTKIFLFFKVSYTDFFTEVILGILTIIISYLLCTVLRKMNPKISAKFLGI